MIGPFFPSPNFPFFFLSSYGAGAISYGADGALFTLGTSFFGNG
jgi:hypothetical protein